MNNKGLALTEFLSIVILITVVILLCIPTFTELADASKMGEVQEHAIGYKSAINKQVAINSIDKNKKNDIKNGIYDAPFDAIYNIKVNGQVPTKGWVEISDGEVNRYSFVMGEYVVSFDGKNNTVVKGKVPNSKPKK